MITTFAGQAGRTRVETAAPCEKVEGAAVEANEQNFDRPEAERARMS